MNKVKYSVLEQAERELRAQFSGTNIEFFRKGDGINKPIYLVVSIPGITKEPDEMITLSTIIGIMITRTVIDQS